MHRFCLNRLRCDQSRDILVMVDTVWRDSPPGKLFQLQIRIRPSIWAPSDVRRFVPDSWRMHFQLRKVPDEAHSDTPVEKGSSRPVGAALFVRDGGDAAYVHRSDWCAQRICQGARRADYTGATEARTGER